MFKSNISFAEEQLLSYLPKTGKYYEANRNYSEYKSNNNTTSLLSPFIRSVSYTHLRAHETQ